MSKSDTEPASGRTRRVSELERRIAESRHLRSLVRDPDLVAVRMDTSRRRTVAGLWVFLATGLVFTTTGVQDFLAGNRAMTDPMWWAAWTVEPMFAGLLIVLLNFEATILAHGIAPEAAWWSRLKHVLLGSTLFMNVVPQLAPLLGAGSVNLGSLAVHAIIPVIVYGLAEVIPIIQARSRAVILASYENADHHTPAETPPKPPEAAPSAPAPAEPEPEPTPVESAASSLDSGADTREHTDPSEVSGETEPAAAGSAVLGRVRPSSVRLPEHVVDKLTDARNEAYRSGRSLTAADIQRLLKLPETLATQLATELAIPDTNGHPVS
ncbi:hypothetical protein SAMN04487905_12112 [Actinopolyspora xinjiangensis]|uniref:DUF2637 domain-containing protein n=1 Tax=Actinopolyspora xinjiangensis TaxID=405564 RepID=A0A1H0X121_9ACTN|nr:hypothetical protein [Actinopolyspora xinjiangensis]SDP96643.1 hypothetical protein SAMN04487905_12112 [Actinopolyspora xinjiangensis]